MQTVEPEAKPARKARRAPSEMTANDMIAVMEPGIRYTVKQLATRLCIPAQDADLLAVLAVQGRSVRRMQTKGGPVFWVPGERELAAEARHLARCAPMSGTLRNYESANSQFRDLCMLTRRS